MIIFTQLLVFSALFFSMNLCYAGFPAFEPLSQEEYPTYTYTLKFYQMSQVDTKKAPEVSELLTESKANTLPTHIKNVSFRFNPTMGYYNADFSEDLPVDIKRSILFEVAGDSIPWHDKKTFRTSTNEIVVIGDRAGPKNLHSERSHGGRTQAMINTCAKNPEIADLIKFILSSPGKQVLKDREDLTIDNIKSILELLVYVYNGKIIEKRAKDFILEVHFSEKHKAQLAFPLQVEDIKNSVYKKLLKNKTKVFLRSFFYIYEPDWKEILNSVHPMI